jgi:3',5'-cyclic AMP phosphodiesterase CpdA
MKERCMPEFRLTQISDTHLTRRLAKLTDNFHRVSEHINATRPDALPVPCRYLPGNHDIGDNPTAVGPAPSEPATEQHLQNFRAVIGEDRWRFDEAGWCFIGLNSLIMNTGLASEAGQFDWLASELARTGGKPVALFLHKPLYLNAPDDPELAASAIRYVPQPARRRLIDMLGAVDLRLVASGHVHQRRDFTYRRVRHVWAPSAGFIISDARQELIAIKETGLVEYRFASDSFEVRHVRAPGQIDVGLDELLGPASKG